MQLQPYYDLGHRDTPDMHSKLFDTESIPERIICKVNFENNWQMTKKNHEKFPSMHRIKDKFIEGAHRLDAHRLCVYLVWMPEFKDRVMQLINSCGLQQFCMCRFKPQGLKRYLWSLANTIGTLIYPKHPVRKF